MHSFIVLVAALSLTGLSLNVPAYERAFDVSENDWTDSLAKTRPTEQLVLSGISDDFLGGKQVKLELERLRISDAESRVVLHGRNGVSQQPLPRRTYLHGEVAGEPGSRALLIIDQDGDLRGIVRRANGMQSLQITPDGVRLVEVDTSKSTRPFQCGNSMLAEPPAATPRIAGPLSTIKQVPANGFLARIAFETDYEYFARFGNADDAAAYAMDLIAFASTIYYSEASTRLALSAIHLWTDDAETDPWNQTDSFCGLLEFGKYWNDNREGSRNADRTIAHFLSGKSNSSGVAWVGVLCRSDFSTTAPDSCNGFSGRSNYGGDYGYTSGIRGNFDLSNPAAIWDFVGVAHEMGHNFDSPHTHCYAGLEGGAEPIDQCYGSEDDCYSGPTSLPGPRGEGSGTIMSYCHQLSGGMNNIGLTLGLDHPYGDAPERVPNRMMAAAIGAEARYPGCLTTELEAEPEPEPGSELSMVGSVLDLTEGESLHISLRLDAPAAHAVTLDLVENSSLAGNFAGLAGHRIPAGTTNLDLQLQTTNDNVYTGPREGQLSIGTITSDASIALGIDTLTVRVIDDEAATTTLTAEAAQSSVTEAETLDVTVSLVPATNVPVSVSLSPDPAIAGRITGGLGPVVVPAGEASVIFNVVFSDNEVDEPDVFATFIEIGSVTSSGQTSVGAQNSVTFDLLDNDQPPPPVVLSLATNRATVAEGESVVATVSLDQSTTVPVSISLRASSALNAQIDSGLTQQVIVPGATKTEFTIVLSDNNQVMQSRIGGTLAIDTVSSSAETTLGSPSQILLEWQDNDVQAGHLMIDSFEGLSLQ